MARGNTQRRYCWEVLEVLDERAVDSGKKQYLSASKRERDRTPCTFAMLCRVDALAVAESQKRERQAADFRFQLAHLARSVEKSRAALRALICRLDNGQNPGSRWDHVSIVRRNYCCTRKRGVCRQPRHQNYHFRTDWPAT